MFRFGAVTIAMCWYTVALLLPSRASAEPDRVPWYLQIYPKNTDYIEVIVDIRGLPTNQYLESANLTVRFYDAQKKFIGRGDFSFIDGEASRLTGGKRYQRFFKHSYSSAQSVEGGRLAWDLGTLGAKPDDSDPRSKDKWKDKKEQGETGCRKWIEDNKENIHSTIGPVPKSKDGIVTTVASKTTITEHTQNSWRRCHKCQGLYYYAKNHVSHCPAGGAHEFRVGSEDYKLIMNASDSPGAQIGWRWCHKCQGLYYAGHTGSHCPAGGAHELVKSADYKLIFNASGSRGQNNWRWCHKCQGLYYAGHTGSHCPAGGAHELVHSGDYSLIIQ